MPGMNPPYFFMLSATSSGLNVIARSEEHTSELQSRLHLVCRLLLEKKKIIRILKRTENIIHRNFRRRQVAIQMMVAINIGSRYHTFRVKVLHLLRRSRVMLKTRHS